MRIARTYITEGRKTESIIEVDTEASPTYTAIVNSVDGEAAIAEPRLPTEEEYDIIRRLLDLPVDLKPAIELKPTKNYWDLVKEQISTNNTPVDHDHETFEKLVRDEEKIAAEYQRKWGPPLSAETAAEMIGDPPPSPKLYKCEAPDCPGLLSPHGMLTCKHRALHETLLTQDEDGS